MSAGSAIAIALLTPAMAMALPSQPSLPARSPERSTTQGTQTETLLAFQTPQYGVRLFRQRGILRLNLYNRQTNKVDLRGMPMQQTVTDTGIVYTNLQGDAAYSVIVAPDGSAYWLKIQQGDRVTYNQQVQNQRAQASEEPRTPDQERSVNSFPASSRSRRQVAARSQPENLTIAHFQTRNYAVRLYDQNGELRMNVYNRQTDRVELRASPVHLNSADSSATYSNPNGDLIYSVTVLPVGGYRLVISQQNRVIHSEQGN
ncbi:MAG: hypothetical protein HC772_15430 [Leptolyngbyaceae cyanobacterium CRU_2_3]|nr:hypothetical protein [Leptolyngbyaceae cyanobacterium CRU_2_3]